MNHRHLFPFLLALTLVACGDKKSDSSSASQSALWLFVHTAETAKMTSENTLVMSVDREIFAFTDRPNRVHAYLNADEFASFWDEGEGDTFKADPPNAVLTWIEGNSVQESEVVITDAVAAEDGRFIDYTVEVVAGAVPSTLSSVSLFIDDVGDVCDKWGMIILPCTICYLGDYTGAVHCPRKSDSDDCGLDGSCCCDRATCPADVTGYLNKGCHGTQN